MDMLIQHRKFQAMVSRLLEISDYKKDQEHRELSYRLCVIIEEIEKAEDCSVALELIDQDLSIYEAYLIFKKKIDNGETIYNGDYSKKVVHGHPVFWTYLNKIKLNLPMIVEVAKANKTQPPTNLGDCIKDYCEGDIEFAVDNFKYFYSELNYFTPPYKGNQLKLHTDIEALTKYLHDILALLEDIKYKRISSIESSEDSSTLYQLPSAKFLYFDIKHPDTGEYFLQCSPHLSRMVNFLNNKKNNSDYIKTFTHCPFCHRPVPIISPLYHHVAHYSEAHDADLVEWPNKKFCFRHEQSEEHVTDNNEEKDRKSDYGGRRYLLKTAIENLKIAELKTNSNTLSRQRSDQLLTWCNSYKPYSHFRLLLNDIKSDSEHLTKNSYQQTIIKSIALSKTYDFSEKIFPLNHAPQAIISDCKSVCTKIINECFTSIPEECSNLHKLFAILDASQHTEFFGAIFKYLFCNICIGEFHYDLLKILTASPLGFNGENLNDIIKMIIKKIPRTKSINPYIEKTTKSNISRKLSNTLNTLLPLKIINKREFLKQKIHKKTKDEELIHFIFSYHESSKFVKKEELFDLSQNINLYDAISKHIYNILYGLDHSIMFIKYYLREHLQDIYLDFNNNIESQKQQIYDWLIDDIFDIRIQGYKLDEIEIINCVNYMAKFNIIESAANKEKAKEMLNNLVKPFQAFPYIDPSDPDYIAKVTDEIKERVKNKKSINDHY